MFCQNCGKEQHEDSKYCSVCGKALSTEPKTIADKEKPVFVISPVFIPITAIMPLIPIAIFMAIWGGGFFGGFTMAIMGVLGLKTSFLPFLLFGLLFFFSIPIIGCFIKKKTYEKTVYRFYPNKFDYYEGFFSIEEKTIAYKKITEVNLRKGVFQRMYGLGTLILSTPATGPNGFSGRSNSGIIIADIKNPDDAYIKIKDLISEFS